MATAERAARRPVALLALIAVVALTAAVFLLVRDDGPSRPEAKTRDAVEVTSSARHRFADLRELLAASDLVISGRVLESERGRVFGGVDAEGTASGQAVRSRVLTIAVGEILASRDPTTAPGPSSVVLVEEEGSLADGTPLVVDGVRSTRVGDAGIWFLVASTDPEFPGFTVVGSQGRYLLTDPADTSRGTLHGGDRSDELVRALEALGLDGLHARIGETASAPAPPAPSG